MSTNKPNVILAMTDDQGWGDTGYNGHPVLQTPHLDHMAAEGIRFDRFYSTAPVCSPTRGGCLTGRHPYRYGIYFANVGHIPKDEITLAEALKTQGYVTGHFGKWHLGTLTKDIIDGRRGGRENEHYSPPWDNGFDTCFSTEVAIPTCDPMQDQNVPSKYWTGPGRWAKENLDGDDSRVIMDRAIPFIRWAAEQKQPFLAVIWFHSPHSPVRASNRHRAMYARRSFDEQHYFGCITAMDEQTGRLRQELQSCGIADNTMLWFCADNGPAGEGGGIAQHPGGRQQGRSGPFRGRKGSLYEGGIRVPGLLVWANRVSAPRVIDGPCSTSDYFPTVLASLGFTLEGRAEPLDGENLMPLIDGHPFYREHPIGFESQKQISLIDRRYKLYSPDQGTSCELYDLLEDRKETRDLAAEKPEIVRKMAVKLNQWRQSLRESQKGKNISPCDPVDG
ncbi:MAG: sulfatase-like hydrolase/transferase [Candidatus Pacebacteria bacterium]|nr:sulfatase-like hydrolase/transferase [Candidatus Paceibacterota bacterium]